MVQALLGAAADVNKPGTYDGRTPLYWASYKGHLEMVLALLGAEADVNKADAHGWTPLHMALMNDHHRVAAVLREAGGHE